MICKIILALAVAGVMLHWIFIERQTEKQRVEINQARMAAKKEYDREMWEFLSKADDIELAFNVWNRIIYWSDEFTSWVYDPIQAAIQYDELKTDIDVSKRILEAGGYTEIHTIVGGGISHG